MMNEQVKKKRILEWVAISLSRGSSQSRDGTCVSPVSWRAGGLFTTALPGKSPRVFTSIIHPHYPRWLSGKESAGQRRRLGFSPRVRRIPWRRKWQPAPVFLPENPMDRGAWWATVHQQTAESDMTERLSTHTHTTLEDRSGYPVIIGEETGRGTSKVKSR